MVRKTIVKVLSYSHFRRIETPEVVFDREADDAVAAAVLCYYSPDANLLSVNKVPRAWCFIEPRWHSMYRSESGRMLKAQLCNDELLWYGNPDPRFRVPHHTHRGELTMMDGGERRGVVALVSNCGNRIWFLYQGFRRRNRLVTHPKVELFGAPDLWRRNWLPLLRRVPRNFRGPVSGGGWTFSENIRFLSRYHAVVCLENSEDPYYFTEKFVNAVLAGCVPIYHATSSVRSEFLSGARWIDPADYGFDRNRVIDAALSADRAEYVAANREWLASGVIAATEESAVWNRIGRIMVQKIESVTAAGVSSVGLAG